MATVLEQEPTSLVPGHSLGPFSLGACIYEVLHLIKSDKELFKQIDLHYEPHGPVQAPVIVNLPKNGIRLRFDGADQRLRLIEVIDFKKIRLSQKGSELVKDYGQGPIFRRTYQIFGASYPGEYLPPRNGSAKGQYVLSWSGIAFTFPLQHSVWSPEKDHVSLLGSSAASPATSMALFEGTSWSDARRDLFVRNPSGSRLSANALRPKDNLPAEIDYAHIEAGGWVTLFRTPPAAPFVIQCGSISMQDLIVELGKPDTVHPAHRPDDSDQARDPPHPRRQSNMSNGRAHSGSRPSSYSSTGTDTFDADFDSGDNDEDGLYARGSAAWWSYFSHGMDILIGAQQGSSASGASLSTTKVVLKVVIHGNVPGCYAFNRHRRLRWNLNFPHMEFLAHDALSSESNFDQDLKPALVHVYRDTMSDADLGRGKVINRTWGGGGGGMSDSSFFLPDAEKDLMEVGGSEQWLGNTNLYEFPGLSFEVLENGVVAALIVS